MFIELQFIITYCIDRITANEFTYPWNYDFYSNKSTKIDLHKYWWNHSTSIFFCTKWIFFINPPPNLELGINVLSVYRSPYILNEIYFCGENLNVLSLDGVDRITRTVSFIHDFVWMNEWNWNKVEYVTNCFVRNILMAADVIISGSWV